MKTLGGLEILVNNVGVINEDDFGKAIDINVVSTFNIVFIIEININIINVIEINIKI